MKILSLIVLLNLGWALNLKSVKKVDFLPGQSMGDVSLGESSEGLMKKGFELDESRQGATSSVTYLKKEKFLARLQDNKLVEISTDDLELLKKFKFRGKFLPSKLNVKSLKKFFKNCEPEVQGSGGQLLTCANRGVLLSTTMTFETISFSVLLPAEVDKIIGPKASKK